MQKRQASGCKKYVQSSTVSQKTGKDAQRQAKGSRRQGDVERRGKGVIRKEGVEKDRQSVLIQTVGNVGPSSGQF